MNTHQFLTTLVLSGTIFLSFVGEVSTKCSDKSNTTCVRCVRDFSCYWCAASKKCGIRPTIKPSSKECDGKWYAFSQCKLSGNLLLIILPVVVVFLLLIVGVCIYCCCCRDCLRRRREKKWAKQDNRRDNKKRDMEAKHAERDEERRIRHDEIRNKYGLFKEEPKYERFDTP